MPDVNRAPMPAPPTRHYRITIQGKLDARWSGWFDGMNVAYDEAQGKTILSGPVPDQTALHGVLAKIRDLNLELISLEGRAPT